MFEEQNSNRQISNYVENKKYCHWISIVLGYTLKNEPQMSIFNL